MDPVRTYLDVFESVRANSRWGQSADIQRYVALVLATAGLPDPGPRVREYDKALTDHGGFFTGVKPPISTILAAMILRRGLTPLDVYDRIEALRERFREHGLSKANVCGLLAAYLLVAAYPDTEVPDAVLHRMRCILATWNADHWWLTGQDDYPMAALHALRDEPVEDMRARIEGIYESLREHGYGRGNQLQLVSHVLSVAPWESDAAVERFLTLVAAFERLDVKIDRSRLDEIALLSLTRGSADAVAGQVERTMRRLRDEKPRPAKSTAFALANGLKLQQSETLADAGDLQAGQAIAAIVAAQTAAMVAVIASTTAATSAAASG